MHSQRLHRSHEASGRIVLVTIFGRPVADDGSEGGRPSLLADVLFGCLWCSDVPGDVFLSGS
jgi:hypothetical protein